MGVFITVAGFVASAIAFGAAAAIGWNPGLSHSPQLAGDFLLRLLGL